DRKSTRLNSSHVAISYAVFCLKKKRIASDRAPGPPRGARPLMCGICGFVGRGDEALLRAMTDRLAHRGPDGSGTRIWDAGGRRPRTGLGHRRLSIIDPTPRGAQPMSYGNGRYWITYNGELYNYRELKRELVAAGLAFESETDTEVLLALYARDGAKMLDRLNGIY